MSDISTGWLIIIVLSMVLISAFFASTETALMSVNRYRLRHQADSGKRSAKLAQKLLTKPDRLIGVILLGNTFANVGTATLTTLLALRLYGETGLLIASGVASILMFVFGDLAPKTFGALYPERLSLLSAWVYTVLDRVLYPVVWAANLVANNTLKLFGVRSHEITHHSLSADEIRTVVAEARGKISEGHEKMLTGVLDLERMTVDDIMVPRNDIVGVNAAGDWDDILEQLRTCAHTRLPLYMESLDNIVGILHMKLVAQHMTHGDLDKESLIEMARVRDALFVPTGTSLQMQLNNFQRNRRRVAFVVNEYGDVLGLVTMEDLLEEIVGEFTTDPSALHRDIHQEASGAFVVSGSINVRTLNRTLGCGLPTDGPRTLNGIILEQLETIPETGTMLKLNGYTIEIMQIADNVVKVARLRQVS